MYESTPPCHAVQAVGSCLSYQLWTRITCLRAQVAQCVKPQCALTAKSRVVSNTRSQIRTVSLVHGKKIGEQMRFMRQGVRQELFSSAFFASPNGFDVFLSPRARGKAWTNTKNYLSKLCTPYQTNHPRRINKELPTMRSPVESAISETMKMVR